MKTPPSLRAGGLLQKKAELQAGLSSAFFCKIPGFARGFHTFAEEEGLELTLQRIYFQMIINNSK